MSGKAMRLREAFMRNVRRNWLFYICATLSTLLFMTLQLLDPAVVRETLESTTFDLRLRLRDALQKHAPPRAARDDILIVLVDERSVREIGRWPWGRETQAALLERISAGRPKVVGVDIMYSERENAASDAAFARALEKAGNVVLGTAFFMREGEAPPCTAEATDALFDSAFMDVRTVPGIPWKKFAPRPVTANPPLGAFSANAALGHVTTLADMDGTLRSELLYLNFGDCCYPSLAVQVARVAVDVPMKEMILFGGSGVRMGTHFVRTDISGRGLINYRGEGRPFPSVSASDVVKGRVPPERFRDKIVLVGTSALATYDQKVTPLSTNMPGVEKNANVVENILTNGFFRQSPGIVELAVIAYTSLLLAVALPRFSALRSLILAVGILGTYLFLACYFLVFDNLRINVIYPYANIFCVMIGHTVSRLLTEERRAREIRRIFSSYVSPKIVEQLVNDPEKAKLGGYRKEVTLLFSDIRGFTSFSEKRQPEEVVAILNEYFTEMTDIVFRWDGTLDKFIGDAILAFWGAPVDQPDHAERALRCALHMSDALDRLRRKWTAEGKEALDIGVGLNTGVVLIGNIGSVGKKMDFTVIGDHVNLGSRVEGLNKTYHSRILITEFTRARIKDLIDGGKFGHYELVRADSVLVKGKEIPVEIFVVRSKAH